MWSWDSRTHQFIVQNALKKCKKSFVNLLQVHQELLILGIEAPDRIFTDFTNHYYNCTPNEYGYHFGCVIKKTVSEIEQLNNMLLNPHDIILSDNYPPFLHIILDTPLKAFIFKLGTLSHYIADLHQPLHTDGKEHFPDEITVHKVFEADTRKHLDELNISLHRRLRINNPQEYFTKVIYEINGLYDAIIDNYYLRPGKVKPDRWNHSVQIVEYSLSQAAQNIANIFLDFEQATSIFNIGKRNALLQARISAKLDFQKRYHLITYPSGTLSIRKNG